MKAPTLQLNLCFEFIRLIKFTANKLSHFVWKERIDAKAKSIDFKSIQNE